MKFQFKCNTNIKCGNMHNDFVVLMVKYTMENHDVCFSSRDEKKVLESIFHWINACPDDIIGLLRVDLC